MSELCQCFLRVPTGRVLSAELISLSSQHNESLAPTSDSEDRQFLLGCLEDTLLEGLPLPRPGARGGSVVQSLLGL